MNFIFDLSGVFFNAGLSIAVKRIAEEYGADPRIVREQLNGQPARPYRTGEITPKEFWQSFAERTGIQNIDHVKELFFSSYHPEPTTVEIINSLKYENYLVGFLSNSPQDRTEYLDKKFHFRSLFDFGLCSYETHLLKPDPAMFRILLTNFDLNPKETWYFDDKENNLDPARDMGCHVMHFTDAKTVKNKLIAERIIPELHTPS